MNTQLASRESWGSLCSSSQGLSRWSMRIISAQQILMIVKAVRGVDDATMAAWSSTFFFEYPTHSRLFPLLQLQLLLQLIHWFIHFVQCPEMKCSKSIVKGSSPACPRWPFRYICIYYVCLLLLLLLLCTIVYAFLLNLNTLQSAG